MARRWGIVVAALVALHGCSYVMMDRPPKAVRRGDIFPGCTSESTYAYVDIALTALAVVGAIAIYSGEAKADDASSPTGKRELTDAERASGGTFALLEGGLFALSANYGFKTSAGCRDLQPKLAPQPYPQPQPYPYPQPQPYPPPQPYPQPQPYPPPPAAPPGGPS